MTQEIPGFEEYFQIFRRRRFLIVGIALLLLVPATVVAFIWPPTYRSTATILIVEQEVPQDFVRSTITSYADQQIERIKAQVMTRSRLMPIIEEHDLYKDLRARHTSAAALKQFIHDIKVEVLSSEVVDKRTGRQTEATIAFTLSYDGEWPGMTQKIANELTTLFLNENLKYREGQVQETTAFLKQETTKFGQILNQLEENIANFKSQAKGALPELFQMNMQLLNQFDRELSANRQHIQEQEARIVYLQGEIARRKEATSTSMVKGEGFVSIGEQLKVLHRQYASLASHLSQEHPDLIKLKGEIKALEREVNRPIGKEELSDTLREEKKNLASLLERYGEDHPDVIRTRGTIAVLEEQVSNSEMANPDLANEIVYDPISVDLHTQLASTKTVLMHLHLAKAKLDQQVREYAERVERTTALEPQYQVLLRERDNAAHKFQEFRSRLSEAQVAEGLELDRKGERFLLVDPPNLPEEPVKPNRPAILLIGVFLAVAGGIGGGVVMESLDRTIHTVERLQAVTKMATLCVVPYLYTSAQVRARLRKRFFLVGGAVVLVGASLGIVHILVLPLDVLWFSALQRLTMG